MALQRFPYTLLDVFTDTALAGNGLAVVHDADSLDDAAMLRFARETRLSETTFVQTPDQSGADYRNRIWTMGGELPFAGHPSLGTAVAVALRRDERDVRYIQETRTGLQPIDVHLDAPAARASMLQPPATFGDEVDPGAALSAVGLHLEDADPRLPPQVVSTGLATLVAPVTHRNAVTKAAPDFAAIDALLDSVQALTFYLVWPDPAGGAAHARMFTGAADMGEDPATGSAAGALCSYLGRRLEWSSVEITQGVEMGRPSQLHAEVTDDGIRVAGGVVVLIQGVLELPVS